MGVTARSCSSGASRASGAARSTRALEGRLDELGAEGWELVHATWDQSVRGNGAGTCSSSSGRVSRDRSTEPASVVPHDDESQRVPSMSRGAPSSGSRQLRQEIAVPRPDRDDDLVRGERRERVADREHHIGLARR